ncbi:hypothetical protein ACHWQZ_G003747 [Mnemiopsis leidyi]
MSVFLLSCMDILVKIDLHFVGVTYVILNLSYHSEEKEFDHSGFNLAGNDTIAIEQHGNLVEVVSTEEKPYYTFIVFVITAPDHAPHRDKIRKQSWAGYHWTEDDGSVIDRWKYVFVVGKTESLETMTKLQAEIEEYQDMIMADELDSYHNLVLKVLWLLQHSVDSYNFSFLVKTDDDSFINIKLLNRYLHEQLNSNSAGKMFFGGARTGRQPVLRRGRYGVGKDLWEPDTYPPYCSGSGYVLSFDSVQELLYVWNTGVQPLFYVEDAFIGTLAYHSGKIEVTNIKGFYWHQKYGCSNKNAMLMHYVKLDQMADFMEKYKQGVAYC